MITPARTMLVAALIVASTPPRATGQASPPEPFHEIGHQGLMHFVVATTTAIRDRAGAQSYARRLCTGQSGCFVHFWTDERRAARAVPMTDAQADAIVASYNINRNTGMDRFVCYNFGAPGEKCS